MTKMTIRVLLADDQLIAREGLKRLLDGVDDVVVAGEAITALEVPRKVEDARPDVVLMDLKWFGDESAGWSAIREVKKKQPRVQIVALTAYENLVRDARQAGADAVLLKTFTKEELISLIRELAKRESVEQTELMPDVDDLTNREREVIRLIDQGKRDREIAELLHISLATVKNHVKKILAKLSVTNRTQAARVARDRGLVR